MPAGLQRPDSRGAGTARTCRARLVSHVPLSRLGETGETPAVRAAKTVRVLSIPVLRIPTHGCMAVISGSSPASKGNRQFPEKPDAGGAPEGRGRAAENLSPDCSARATSSSLLNLVLQARFGKQTNKNGIRPSASSELPGKVAGGRRGELSFSRSACPVDRGACGATARAPRL